MAGFRTGPSPDPNALARNSNADRAGWTVLSTAPITEPPPAWPLTAATRRELHLWALMWTRPQSVLWRAQSQELEVALHCRSFAEAEVPGAQPPKRVLVRQQMDALLLTIPSMLAARIKLQADPLTGRRGAAPGEVASPASSSRARLQSKATDDNGNGAADAA